MPVAFLGIFYALLIRPQQKQQKEHEKLVSEIKSGDRVVAAGMVGTIITVKDKSVTLRTGESKIEVVRTSVERVITAYRLKPYGEALAVTNDFAERDTVISMGGLAQSCEEFISDIDRVLKERDDFVKVYNRREANRYKR